MRRLVAEAGGPADWARKYGGSRWQQPQVSQWISETSPKGIGGRLARDLEVAMGMSRGELDSAPSRQSQPVGIDIDTLRSAHRLLQLVAEIRGEPPVPEINVTALAVAYETVRAEAASLDDSNVLDFMRAFVARLDKVKGDGDGTERRAVEGTG
ncbi:hypothetical protein [Stenotrophomonas maltophilia]|uniref:hypothetical protein n=1 Tax=Stenotrophomonas maltophilia TaxID=40324 RepID=UPI0039C16750